jgi:Dna[CI] antecedent, DciA
VERRSRIEEEALFVRMAKAKTRQRPAAHTLGDSLVDFYKGTVQRTRKFAGIGEVWETLVPPDLNEHCCLESYRAGVLTVLVDSSPHLYRIKQLLLAGLQKQILELCRVQGLRKISLKPGRWYAGEEGEDRRLMFGR